jgi:hypothetical protein
MTSVDSEFFDLDEFANGRFDFVGRGSYFVAGTSFSSGLFEFMLTAGTGALKPFEFRSGYRFFTN